MPVLPRDLLTVAAGGAVGAALRQGAVLVWPVGAVDLTILVVNVVGALMLGVLLTWLARLGPDVGRRRDLRLLLGTGVLGGFTTYSTLAVDTAHLVEAQRSGMALAYCLGTVLLGAAASLGGIWCGARLPAPAGPDGQARRTARSRGPAQTGGQP